LVRAFDHDTGERLLLIDGRGKRKARKKRDREGRFGLMYKMECAEDVLTNQALSHFEARLAIFLFVRTDWENQVRMSQSAIATAMHVPDSQISRTVKKLIGRGIIRLVERGVFEVNPRFFFTGEDDEREYAIKDRGHLFTKEDEERKQ